MSIRVFVELIIALENAVIFVCVCCFPSGTVGEMMCLREDCSCKRQDGACRKTSVTNPFCLRESQDLFVFSAC